MKLLWCWRCRQELPMLEGEEPCLVAKAHVEEMPFVEAEARRLGKSLSPEISSTGMARRQRPMLEMHRLLTGFEETNPNAVWHHIVELYGPPCPPCRKPLRTSEARFCAACGFGQADIATDARPLVLSKPELAT